MAAVLSGVLVLAGAMTGAVLWGASLHSGPTATAGMAGPTAPPAPVSTSGAAPASTSPPTADATTPPASFADLYRQDSSGIVRIDTVSCDADGVGTGFLLSPTVVATVAHVVDQSAVISLDAAGHRTTGTVIGMDLPDDLALVRTDAPLDGHQFTLSPAAPPVGTRVAAIGFPLGEPMTLTQGGISGLDRSIPINGTTRSGLIQTDTPLNPGNSGGPLIDPSGQVVGLVDALNTQANGIAYAVPATQAAPIFSTWRTTPQTQPPAACADARGPDVESAPDLNPSGLPPGPLTALVTYFTGINTGDYAAAYAVLSPAKQRNVTLSTFGANLATSYDSDFHVLGVTDNGGSTTVGLAFTSLQAPAHGPSGDTCDNWTLDYRMIQDAGGSWRIDQASAHNGSTHTAC